MFEDKRQATFKAVEDQVIKWWRHLDNIAQKDKVEGFVTIETESLKAVFKAVITEVEKVFSERDKIPSPEVEIQNVMDFGARLLARVLRFSNIKSGRESWLNVMADGEGQSGKTIDLEKRSIEEKSRDLLPVWKRGAIRLEGDDDNDDSDLPIWLR